MTKGRARAGPTAAAMIRTLIKLLLLAVVVNAGIKTVPAFWTYYKFRDAVEETAKYSSRRTKEEVASRVLQIAARMDVPLDPSQLRVTKHQARTRIVARYNTVLEPFPTKTYPWDFQIDVEGEPPRYEVIP